VTHGHSARLKGAVLRGVSLALVMSAILWVSRWSDSPLGLGVFFALTAAVLSTGAYVRAGRGRVWSSPTQPRRHGDF
jgi:uncharacterized membrane protein